MGVLGRMFFLECVVRIDVLIPCSAKALARRKVYFSSPPCAPKLLLSKTTLGGICNHDVVVVKLNIQMQLLFIRCKQLEVAHVGPKATS